MLTGESAVPLSRLFRGSDAEGGWARIKKLVPAFVGGSAGNDSGQASDAASTDNAVSLSYIDSLHAFLAHRGVEVSKTYLMGISGDAFKFFYDHIHPARSMWVFLHNPLRAACSALGLKHDIPFFEHQKDALEAVAEHHDKGEPVILQFGDVFPIVYPDLRALMPDGEVTLTRGELEQQWSASDGFLELGLYGYHLFTIGELDQDMKQRDIYLGAFRRARKIAHIERRVRGCFIGLRAFDGMSTVLTAKRDVSRVRPVELERIAEWNGLPSLHLLESRRAAAQFLGGANEAFEEEEEQEALADAAKHYDRVVEAFEQVRARHPTSDPDGPSKCVFRSDHESLSKRELSRFARACRRAASSLEGAREAEDKAVGQLGKIISVSEKTRM